MIKTGIIFCFGLIFSSSVFALSVENGLREAIEKSPDIREKSNQYIEISKDKNIAIASWFPSLSFVGDYEYIKYDSGPYLDQISRSTGLELKFNLFNGFSDWNRYDTEKARLISAAAKVLEERNKISLEVIENYLEVLKNKDFLKIAKLSLKNHTKMYKKIKKKVDVGLGRQLEERHSQSSLGLARFSYRVQERNLAQELIKFSKLLERMVPVENFIDPKPKICIESSFADMYKKALVSHPSIAIAKHNVNVVKQEYEASISGYLPTLDMTANYYVDNFLSTINQIDNYDISLSFKYNLFNGLADSNKRQKEQFKVFQKQDVLKKNKRDVKNRLHLAWSSYQLNKEKYSFSKMNVLSKQDTLRAYDYEFMLGRASLNAMLDANEAYYAALKDKTSAYYELLLDYYAILEASGLIYKEVTRPKSSHFMCQNRETFRYDLRLDTKEAVSLEGKVNKNYKCYRVISNKLHIRLQASINSKINGFLIRDTIFCSRKKLKPWIRLEKGWVHEDYVQNVSLLQ